MSAGGAGSGTQQPPHRSRSTRRPRTGVALRISLLVAAVAVLTALIAGVVGTALVRSASADTAQRTLADQADVVAAQLDQDGPGERLGLRKVSGILAGQGISVARVGPRGRVATDDDAVRSAVEQAGARPGASTSARVRVDGTTMLVEARPVNQGTVALVAPLDIAGAVKGGLQRRVLLALALGVGVAVVAGLVFARLLTRPLRRTAAVAHAMAGGDRAARVEVAGPAEVAEVASAVNDLADALAHSESRQKAFLTSVSHELRTPLAGIAGQADALADGIVPPGEVPDVAATIRAEAARMERLVSDLLDLARLGADSFTVDLQPIDVVDLVRSMASVWQIRCGAAGVELRTVLPDAPVIVRTDPRRLRQVLDGLAENALRVLPAGRPLVLQVLTEPGSVVVQVRDGGPGLAPEDYPVAFQQGVLHDRYRGVRPVGAGLGLALAKQLVDRIGGTIVAAPAPEGGVAMTIRLPAGIPDGPITAPIPTGPGR